MTATIHALNPKTATVPQANVINGQGCWDLSRAGSNNSLNPMVAI